MADIAIERTAVTLDDLMALGEDARVEVINGEVVEMAPVGGLHHLVNGNILRVLDAYVNEHELGIVFMDNLLYLMNENPHHLRGSFAPDLSFIRKENIPAKWDLSLPFPGIPDFAVEVMSPGDDAQDVQVKVRAYLDKGTEQVWVVYPLLHEVHQHRRDAKTIRIYRGDEQIDTESMFPGFILTMEMVFKLPAWMGNSLEQSAVPSQAEMTIPEQIMTGVAIVVRQQGHDVFTRQEIRDALKVDAERWTASYAPNFQGMRIDHPGGAPNVNQVYKGIFRRISYGRYELTDHGKTVLEEF